MSDASARTHRGALQRLAVLLRRLRRVAYLDIGAPDATTFVVGMGRSGTTWVSGIINHDFSYRVVFEPFRSELVPAAAPFGAFAYVRPSDRDPVRLRAAEAILSGRTPRGSVDRGHQGFLFRRRIVKGVRANLMLAWLKSIRPHMPIVLVIRNPFAVAASWSRLGWGLVADGVTAELDVILRHPELHADFPEIRTALRGLDPADRVQRTIAEWCILHLVPLRQLNAGDVHLLYYEDLLLEPVSTVDSLAAYLGRPITGAGRDRALMTATATDFLRRGNAADRNQLLGDWKNILTLNDVDRGRLILDRFGLAHLYDDDGVPTAAARTHWPIRA
jgi:hypothetical protein